MPTPAWSWSDLSEGSEVYVLSMIDEHAGEPCRGNIDHMTYLQGGLGERSGGPAGGIITEVVVNVAGVPFNVSPRDIMPVDL